MTAVLDDVKVGGQFDTWLRNELDRPVVCEQPGCDQAAKWRFRVPCCGNGHNLCTPHKVKWVETGKMWEASLTHQPTCSRCGHAPLEIDKVVWTEL